MGKDSKLNVKSLIFNSFRENCYVLWDERKRSTIIDPGCVTAGETSRLEAFIAKEGLRPEAIWLTHGHFDHIYGVAFLCEEYSIPVLMNPAERTVMDYFVDLAVSFGMPAPDISFTSEDISDGQEAGLGFKVITTPGHSPGGVCYYNESERLLLSGDTLFAGAIGRTDHPGGDYDKEIVSIMDKLMGLPGEVEVLPGHGPSTTIAYERANNPFLQPWGDPEEDGMI